MGAIHSRTQLHKKSAFYLASLQIDHIERELVQLTHERDLIGRGVTGAAGIRKTGKPRRSGGGGGGDDSDGDDGGSGGGGSGGGGSGGRGKSGLRKEDAYALEMQLQLKRAEREQRRLQLSVEFASTFADVSEKKRQLDRLSAAVADIEATRLRKSREFGHMQVLLTSSDALQDPIGVRCFSVFCAVSSSLKAQHTIFSVREVLHTYDVRECQHNILEINL